MMEMLQMIGRGGRSALQLPLDLSAPVSITAAHPTSPRAISPSAATNSTSPPPLPPGQVPPPCRVGRRPRPRVAQARDRSRAGYTHSSTATEFEKPSLRLRVGAPSPLPLPRPRVCRPDLGTTGTGHGLPHAGQIPLSEEPFGNPHVFFDICHQSPVGSKVYLDCCFVDGRQLVNVLWA